MSEKSVNDPGVSAALAGAPASATSVGEAGYTEPAKRTARRRPALLQPKQPVFWLLAVLGVPALVMTAIECVTMAEGPSALLAAVLLVGTQAALMWLILRAIPRTPKPSVSLAIAALVWGGAIAITIAGTLNGFMIDVLHLYGIDSLAASIAAPINEDLLRFAGIVVVLTLASTRPLTIADGVRYGFLVGAGFELVENLTYALNGADLGETLTVGLLRLIVGFGLHAFWSATTGAMLAYCLMRRQQGRVARWWLLVPALLVPMALHAAWDMPSISALEAVQLVLLGVLYLITLALFIGVVVWARRSSGLRVRRPTAQGSIARSAV